MAQQRIRKDGVIDLDDNKLESFLSTVASILGFFVVKAPTPVGVALSAVSLGLGLSTSEKDILTNLSIDGEDYLAELYDFMKNNPQYDLIEFEYPYLTYFDVNDEGEDITFVTGEVIVKRVHVEGGGWIIL
jgi:hypothetical protein